MLGHLHAKNNYCMYMTIKLSQLMLNLYEVSRARSFSLHAVHMLSLCEYYDLYSTTPFENNFYFDLKTILF